MELGGNQMRRSALINALCVRDEDLVVLSSPGYRSLVFFRDNTIATLKMIKDDEDDENLEAVLDVVAQHIRNECSQMEYLRHTYNTSISKELSQESVPDTLQLLLDKLSLDDQSLPSLLIGNIVTSVITKHPTPLQLAFGVFFHKKKLKQYNTRSCWTRPETSSWHATI